MTGRFAQLSEEERAARFSPVERIAMMPAAERKAFLRRLPPRLKGELLLSWHGLARPGQRPPDGDWRIWLLMGGRGYGKTMAGAQWVHRLAEAPGLRIALVGPTEDEVRTVMIEGTAGILACARQRRPDWEPSLGRLTWPNGTRASVHSGANPEALRGPEHDYAWCDEIAKWAHGQAAWDNLMFGLRRGDLPRALVTTTPRPTPLMRRLAGRADVAKTRGRTADAALLAESFTRHVTGLYGGTRLGRQELDGELIEDVEGSLWPRDLIERCRADPVIARSEATRQSTSAEAGLLGFARNDAFRRVAIGVDPPASTGGACGIVVCALAADDIAYVLADASVAGLSPEGWARAAAAAAARWGADRVVAEGNQGGAMVESVLRGADVNLPVRIVHASIGKAARAEPVAALFERGAARFAGAFPELEDELAGLIAGGGYEGPGASPDRADAMVWAMTELMLGPKRAEPRITLL
jgi:phage terminase large subunit-like protein